VNVLILSHMFPTTPGSAKGIFVLEQTRALRKLGVNCTLVAPVPWVPRLFRGSSWGRNYQNIPRRTNVDGLYVECPPVLSFPGAALFSLSGLTHYLSCRATVRRIVRSRRIDLIHAHTILPDGFAALLLARQLHIPLVCTLHGSDVKLYPRRSRAIAATTRWALQRIEHLVAVSDDVAKAALFLGARCKPLVVHNGADRDSFQPRAKVASRTALGLPLEKKVVLFVGNLIPLKGADLLIRAMAQMKSEAVLVLVGDGPLRSDLATLANQLGIESLFVGARQHSEIPLWLTAADCLVLPSLSEGLPAVLPEAMLCRTPIVASAVGGTPEIIRNGETGQLVPPSNIDELSLAIASVLSAEPARNAFVLDRAQKLAQESLTWEINAHRTLELYEAALAHYAFQVSEVMPALNL